MEMPPSPKEMEKGEDQNNEHQSIRRSFEVSVPDSKVHGANMGPTWVLSAPDGPHVGPMNLAIRGIFVLSCVLAVELLHGYQLRLKLASPYHED